MRNILFRYIPMIFVLVALNSHAKMSQTEKTALVNKWLEVTFNKRSKSRSNIMSKVMAQLSDRDRFVFNKHLSRKRKGRVYAKGNTLLYDVNGRLYSFKIQKNISTIIVNGVKTISYDKDNIWVSIRKAFRKKKKTVFLWNPFVIDTAFADFDVSPLFEDGVSEELFTFTAVQNFIPMDVDRNISIILKEAGYKGDLGHPLELLLGDDAERASVTCDSKKTPPSLSGKFPIPVDGKSKELPIRYESNKLKMSTKGLKGTSSRDMAVEFTQYKRTKGEQKSCVKKYRRMAKGYRETAIIYDNIAKEDGNLANIHSESKFKETSAGAKEQAEEYRATAKIYDGMVKKGCLEDQLGIKASECKGCTSVYGVVGEVANTQQLEKKLMEAAVEKSNIMIKFRDKYNLKEENEIGDYKDLKIGRKLSEIQKPLEKLKGVERPEGVKQFNKWLSNLEEDRMIEDFPSDLEKYRKELTEKEREISILRGEINKDLDKAKKILADRALLAGYLSDCCADNECKAKLSEGADGKIFPAGKSEATQ